MNKRVLTVIQFEFLSFLKYKLYVILTAVLCLLVFAAFFLPGLLAGDGQADVIAEPAADRQILYVSGGSDRELAVLGDLLPEFSLQASAEPAKALLASDSDEPVYGVLSLSVTGSELTVPGLAMTDYLPGRIQRAVEQMSIISSLREAGMPEGEAFERVVNIPFSLRDLSADEGKGQSQNYIYAYIILMLLYLSVIIYGQVVAGNIASEKGNRTMELLITSTKPLNLLVGKVMGSGLAGLLQLTLILGSALVSYSLNRAQLTELMPLGEVTPAMLLYTLLFFTLGYFTSAFLFSALGSLVSRTEDGNRTGMAISFPLIAVFMAAMSALFNPAASYVRTLTFVPFFAPFLMLVRTQMLVVPPREILLSVVISLVTLAGVAWISAKIYRRGTLFYGNSVKPNELMRMLRY